MKGNVNMYVEGMEQFISIYATVEEPIGSKVNHKFDVPEEEQGSSIQAQNRGTDEETDFKWYHRAFGTVTQYGFYKPVFKITFSNFRLADCGLTDGAIYYITVGGIF